MFSFMEDQLNINCSVMFILDIGKEVRYGYKFYQGFIIFLKYNDMRKLS